LIEAGKEEEDGNEHSDGICENEPEQAVPRSGGDTRRVWTRIRDGIRRLWAHGFSHRAFRGGDRSAQPGRDRAWPSPGLHLPWPRYRGAMQRPWHWLLHRVNRWARLRAGFWVCS